MTFRLILTAIFAFPFCLPVRAQDAALKPLPAREPADRLDGPPVVTAKGWVVADGKTGRLLWGAKEDEPLPIASTTKIMTAWVVLKFAAADPKVLDEELTVTERAAKTTGSAAGIKTGEKYVVRDLLYGLLLPSGNDAAAAFAEHFGPRCATAGDGDAVARFVGEMNRQAAELKMAETKYLDPHGLSKNMSSPRDLAALTSRALKIDWFQTFVQTRRYQCEATTLDGQKRVAVWENTNRLLGMDGYDGVKTGTTNAAGACLVASGKHGQDHLIVVVLGCASTDGRYADSRNLFRWAWKERSSAVGGNGPTR